MAVSPAHLSDHQGSFSGNAAAEGVRVWGLQSMCPDHSHVVLFVAPRSSRWSEMRRKTVVTARCQLILQWNDIRCKHCFLSRCTFYWSKCTWRNITIDIICVIIAVTLRTFCMNIPRLGIPFLQDPDLYCILFSTQTVSASWLQGEKMDVISTQAYEALLTPQAPRSSVTNGYPDYLCIC